jgi:hypothetical protein
MPSSRSSGQRENRITTAVLLVAIAVVGILIVLP